MSIEVTANGSPILVITRLFFSFPFCHGTKSLGCVMTVHLVYVQGTQQPLLDKSGNSTADMEEVSNASSHITASLNHVNKNNDNASENEITFHVLCHYCNVAEQVYSLKLIH